MSDLTADKKG